MTDKMTCPGCDAHTSRVQNAFESGEACPHCGLSHSSSFELFEKQRTVAVSRANDAVKRIADEALRKVGVLQAENDRLNRIVELVRSALDGECGAQ